MIGHIKTGIPTHLSRPNINFSFHPQAPKLNLISLLWLIPIFIFWKISQFVLRNKKLGDENLVFLEITPPSYTDKGAYTTSQLFSHLHGVGYSSKQDQLLNKAPSISLEIVSTKTEGIRYLIGVKPEHVDTVKRSLLSYLPEVKIKEVDCYIPQGYKRSEKFHSAIANYGLSSSFGFPLKSQDSLKEHDPVAFLTGMMTQLDPGELISFQMILSPAELKEREKIKTMINKGEDAIGYMKKPAHSLLGSIGIFTGINLLKLVGEILEEGGKFLRETLSSTRSIEIQRANDLEYIKRKELAKLQPRIITEHEREINKMVMDKLNESLFFVSLRLLVIAKDKKGLMDRINGFSSFMDTFTFHGYQALKKRSNLFELAWSKI